MRIILNDEIFLDADYLELTKPETDRLFKIVALFAKEDKEELSLAVIRANFDVSDEFMERTSFCLKYGKNVLIKRYFSWFKGNRDYAAKSRAKPKEEIITSEGLQVIVPEVKAKPADSNDYEKIKESFNSIFEGTTVPKIKTLTPKRTKSMKNLYVEMKKIKKLDYDIYQFYEGYFNLLKDDTKFNYCKGWMNKSSNSWFQPDIDFYLNTERFAKVYDAYLD